MLSTRDTRNQRHQLVPTRQYRNAIQVSNTAMRPKNRHTFIDDLVDSILALAVACCLLAAASASALASLASFAAVSFLLVSAIKFLNELKRQTKSRWSRTVTTSKEPANVSTRGTSRWFLA